MVDIKKYKDKDLYGLLGIDISATEQEVRYLKLISFCRF